MATGLCGTCGGSVPGCGCYAASSSTIAVAGDGTSGSPFTPSIITEALQDLVAPMLTGVGFTYNDPAGTLTSGSAPAGRVLTANGSGGGSWTATSTAVTASVDVSDVNLSLPTNGANNPGSASTNMVLTNPSASTRTALVICHGTALVSSALANGGALHRVEYRLNAGSWTPFILSYHGGANVGTATERLSAMGLALVSVAASATVYVQVRGVIFRGGGTPTCGYMEVAAVSVLLP